MNFSHYTPPYGRRPTGKSCPTHYQTALQKQASPTPKQTETIAPRRHLFKLFQYIIFLNQIKNAAKCPIFNFKVYKNSTHKTSIMCKNRCFSYARTGFMRKKTQHSALLKVAYSTTRGYI